MGDRDLAQHIQDRRNAHPPDHGCRRRRVAFFCFSSPVRILSDQSKPGPMEHPGRDESGPDSRVPGPGDERSCRDRRPGGESKRHAAGVPVESIGPLDVWVKDLKTGRDSQLTEAPTAVTHPIFSGDSSVIYGVVEAQKMPLFRQGVEGGVPERICDNCGNPYPYHCSSDETKLLYLDGQPPMSRYWTSPPGRRDP